MILYSISDKNPKNCVTLSWRGLSGMTLTQSKVFLCFFLLFFVFVFLFVFFSVVLYFVFFVCPLCAKKPRQA
jgi:hypothetical protein